MSDDATPVCRRLRSKGFYQAEADDAEQFDFSHESACWCARTTTALGPDTVLCSLDMCHPDRACFEAR